MRNIKRSILIAGTIAIMIIVIYYFITSFSNKTGTICLVRGITGVPCPSCGITRAVKAVLNGNLKEAFYYNPLFWLPFLVAILTLIKPKYFIKILIVSIVLLIITYGIRMFLLFPNKEPLEYNENAIIFKLIENR